MMKFWIALLLILLSCSAFGATTCLGAKPNDPGVFSLRFGSDVFVNTNNDYLTMVDAGFRIGLPNNLDLGLLLYKTGIILDARMQILNFPYFITSADLEIDGSQLYSMAAFAGSMIVSWEASSLFSVYLTAKWRYPAIMEIDGLGGYAEGVVFMPKMGIELFRAWQFNVLAEIGIAKSWKDQNFYPTAGAMLSWRF